MAPVLAIALFLVCVLASAIPTAAEPFVDLNLGAAMTQDSELRKASRVAARRVTTRRSRPAHAPGTGSELRGGSGCDTHHVVGGVGFRF